MKNLNQFQLIKYLFVFLLGICATYSYVYFSTSQSSERDLRNYQSSSIIRKASGNKFISPLLLTGDSRTTYVGDDFTSAIGEYINSKKRDGSASDISFYMKNLRNSSWTGVDEDKHYAPASLMKVPIMMAIYKEGEDNPEFLNKKILYKINSDYNSEEYFQPKDRIIPGKSYTVEELLRYMINYSDNNAMSLLINQISPKKITDIFNDLGLPIPENNADGTIDYMSAKLYSRLFRVLYNCTYLNEEDSAKALELLSGSDFPNGIVSQIPGNVIVSNKFGERTVYNPDKTLLYRELHDCGIVYAGDNPYALCIMTKGTDFTKLEKIIQDISKMAYDEMK